MLLHIYAFLSISISSVQGAVCFCGLFLY